MISFLAALIFTSTSAGGSEGLVAFRPSAPALVVFTSSASVDSECVDLTAVECELTRAALYWERRARESEHEHARDRTSHAIDVLVLKREIALLEESPPAVESSGFGVFELLAIGAGAFALGCVIGASAVVLSR